MVIALVTTGKAHPKSAAATLLICVGFEIQA